MRAFGLLVLLILALGCSDPQRPPPPPGGGNPPDNISIGGPDNDAGFVPDGGVDGGVDAGADAGVDAG